MIVCLILMQESSTLAELHTDYVILQHTKHTAYSENVTIHFLLKLNST